jgi:drug/metabolite transporter (DMT)-like permease
MLNTLPLLVAMTVCTVVANLLMKLGATAQTDKRGLLGLLDWRVILGVFFFGMSAVIYVRVLEKLPLNRAQSFLAIQYVCVILASAFILSEPIPLGRWAGMGFIVLGIALVAKFD